MCNPSKGIPADITRIGDVATRKYKSTWSEDNGSFCCSVSALCVLCVIYCCLYRIFIMAIGKHESDKQRFRLCVPPCPRFIMGGDTHSLCFACLGVEHAQSALEGNSFLRPERGLGARVVFFWGGWRERRSRRGCGFATTVCLVWGAVGGGDKSCG